MIEGESGPREHARPVLIFDGDCSFCRRWVGRWRALTGDAIEFAPSQEAAPRFPQIPKEAFDESVWLVEPDGKVTGAAGAVFRSLRLAGQKRHLLWAYEHVPGVAGVSEWLYERVARNRGTLDKLDLWLIPNPLDPKRSYRLTRSIFLRGLGLVYLIAFLSLYVQVDGLIGSRGILPAGDYLASARNPEISLARQFFLIPTLCWWNAGNAFLHFLCLGGIALSCVLIVGLFPAPLLFLLWLFYLSLTTVGQAFLGYQWDGLLLEAGFLSIFFAPLSWRIEARAAPARIPGFLLKWLLFRLMFLSGLVKLASRTDVWRSLAAMRFHYQTQPIPTWTSWYVHQAPNWFQAMSVLVVFAVELIAPLLFFGKRRLRLIACWAAVGFQVLILLTGNYGFFNLLAIVLCVVLLDDGAIRTLLRRKHKVAESTKAGWLKWPWWITAPLACVLIPLSLVPALLQVGRPQWIPPWLAVKWLSVAQFDSINGYGLFADMTTQRPELIVEGSNDGTHWTEYQFKWKPGDVHRPPRFSSPHMPRLDWQMWFAALSPPRYADVLHGLLDRLHEGSPDVLALLDKPPFGKPPRYLRIVEYDYRFTSFSERSGDGAWWKREKLGQISLP
jgi:predicted DCC family thiol-disulfide oxidoreductase YuxK